MEQLQTSLGAEGKERGLKIIQELLPVYFSHELPMRTFNIIFSIRRSLFNVGQSFEKLKFVAAKNTINIFWPAHYFRDGRQSS